MGRAVMHAYSGLAVLILMLSLLILFRDTLPNLFD